ncbi:Glucokinase (EC [Olavius sp. associated proteobacterium Delta 1]|nr:Glucokinase (EC [Olavius sp. associated proteobacterium Delta 1]
MTNPLEITGDDIAKLDDADLRTLIGRLCEEDYRLAGLPTKGITWGGHQDAPDGGLDVVVRDDVQPPQNSFVPRGFTGFQVKKPDMPRSSILAEMRPKGTLRPIIKNLIMDKGAYIVASSGANATGTALQERIDAMREAVSTEDDHENLHLDFLDRGRIATWVRSHPSLLQWVLDRVGRRAKGWYPYANWANPKAGVEEEYILDEGLRLHDGQRRTDNGLSVHDGILHLRSVLSAPKASVRLTGLSGVGKTRLAQAMFDDRVGTQALNPDRAFYTDVAFGPDPDPRAFAEQLIAGRTRAVLIVDNCMPELHRQLTQVCSVEDSTVSLLTIEYDVREDLPEETSVFRLEPASADLIQKLVRNRFGHISQVDARTIAEFSGGNARIAIALANTVDRDESLAGLRDEDLFKRLFEQRHGTDKDLLASAEVCSLVYSFEGTDTESGESELNFLASLIVKPGDELYRDVATIKERDLIQSRDVWRAVLPQAIADRLAKRALESIPKDKLVGAFLSASERLIKSFSRRLGYLHDSNQAVEIVEGLLSPDGWLGEANCNFNDLGMDAFRNVAPVSPEKTLEMIERAANGADGSKFTSRENKHHHTFAKLLRQLAYGPALFDRSVEIICRFALSEDADERDSSARDVLKSLFYLHLSGTHAPVEAKARIIEGLVDSDNERKQELGITLLQATLEASHFTASYEFGFGARSRDYGYRPKTRKDIEQWYGTFIDICTRLAISGTPIAEKARKLLADKLRGLWNRTGMFDVLENAAIQINKHQPWDKGWIAVKKIIHYDSKNFSEEVSTRIHKLEENLRPDNLYDIAIAFVLSDKHISFGLSDEVKDDGDKSDGWQRAGESAHMLGTQVAQESDTIGRLLPDLVLKSNSRIRNFGAGLAEGSAERKELWQAMRASFESAQPENRQTCVMEGLLSECTTVEHDLYDSILDELVEDELLCEYFPIFQMTSTIDQKGIERLNRALDAGKAKIEFFRGLAWGRAHEPISDDDLVVLLEKIFAIDDSIATEILMMRFHENKDPAAHSERLVAFARDVLCRYQFTKDRRRHDSQDHQLSQIALVGLRGDDGGPAAVELCQHLLQAIKEHNVYAKDYPTLLTNISKVQPLVFLDVFIGDDKKHQQARTFNEDFEHRENPLDQISDDDIISWCENDPANRYPLIASAMKLFKEDDGKLTWKPLLSRIFDGAPELEPVFDGIARNMIPNSWSGSRAEIVERQSELLKELFEHDNAQIGHLAKAKYVSLQRQITEMRKSEGEMFRTRFESFE